LREQLRVAIAEHATCDNEQTGDTAAVTYASH